MAAVRAHFWPKNAFWRSTCIFGPKSVFAQCEKGLFFSPDPVLISKYQNLPMYPLQSMYPLSLLDLPERNYMFLYHPVVIQMGWIIKKWPILMQSGFDLSSISFFQRGTAQDFITFTCKILVERTAIGSRQSVSHSIFPIVWCHSLSPVLM